MRAKKSCFVPRDSYKLHPFRLRSLDLLHVQLLLRGLRDVLDVLCVSAAQIPRRLRRREVGNAGCKGLLALGVAPLPDLLGESGGLGTDEPRLLPGKQEVEVLEGLAGRLDI